MSYSTCQKCKKKNRNRGLRKWGGRGGVTELEKSVNGFHGGHAGSQKASEEGSNNIANESLECTSF